MNIVTRLSRISRALLALCSPLLIALPTIAAPTPAQAPQKTSANGSETFAYVFVGFRSGKVLQYRVRPDGGLTRLASIPAPPGDHPYAAAATPDGRFLYTGISDVRRYRIQADGTLAPLSPMSLAPPSVDDIQITPDGRFAYIVNTWGNNVSQFRIQKDGTLLPLAPATISPGLLPISLAIDPTGRFAYVLIENRGEPLGYGCYLTQYRIGADGQLQPLSPRIVSDKGILFPGNIVVDPKGDFAYVADGDGILVYRINSDGTLQLTYQPKSSEEVKVKMVMAAPTGRTVYGLTDPPDRIIMAHVQPDGTLTGGVTYSVRDDGTLTTDKVIPKSTSTSVGSTVKTTFEGANFSSMALTSANTLYAAELIKKKLFRYQMNPDGTLETSAPVVTPLDDYPFKVAIVQRRQVVSPSAPPRPASRRGRAARRR